MIQYLFHSISIYHYCTFLIHHFIYPIAVAPSWLRLPPPIRKDDPNSSHKLVTIAATTRTMTKTYKNNQKQTNTLRNPTNKFKHFQAISPSTYAHCGGGHIDLRCKWKQLGRSGVPQLQKAASPFGSKVDGICQRVMSCQGRSSQRHLALWGSHPGTPLLS